MTDYHPPNSRVGHQLPSVAARFDLVPPFELPFEGPSMDPIILEPPGTVDPLMEEEDLIVDASNMNFMHVPAEAGGWFHHAYGVVGYPHGLERHFLGLETDQ